jgi:hypothetical protein
MPDMTSVLAPAFAAASALEPVGAREVAGALVWGAAVWGAASVVGEVVLGAVVAGGFAGIVVGGAELD